MRSFCYPAYIRYLAAFVEDKWRVFYDIRFEIQAAIGFEGGLPDVTIRRRLRRRRLQLQHSSLPFARRRRQRPP